MIEETRRDEAASESKAPDDNRADRDDTRSESSPSEPGRGVEPAAGNGDSTAPPTPEREDVVTLSKGQHEELLKKAREQAIYLDELRRLKADFENYQKRVRRERPGWEAQAVRGLIQDILPIVDNFERALDSSHDAESAAIVQGLRMVHEMIVKTLESHGIKEIRALGKPFDPQYHEAVMQVETEDSEKDGAVVDVQQKGYLHGETVVRPTRVVVGKKAVPAPSDDGDLSSPE